MHARTALVSTLLLAAASGTALAQDEPDTITLSGKVRDFVARNDGGHTDFQWRPSNGFGHYIGMVGDELDEDGKPVMASTGYKVINRWRDGEGRHIMQPREHFPALESDSPGYTQSGQGGALHTPDDFEQWFRDVHGVNASTLLPITLTRQPGSDLYVFDDKDDEYFQSVGGFFPINGELYGNYRDTGKNFHFTLEMSADFVYKAESGQVFTFIGDDDVWVFIDGKCVIDLGGVHGATAQTVDLDRLTWLEDGEDYELKFFFAERHTTQSNFRIETSLNLKTVTLPTTLALFD